MSSNHRSPSMATTIQEISTAINQIPIKKQTLYNQFLHLQSLTPSSFSLPFNWSHIDAHFTSLYTSLQSKLNLLQTFNPLTRPELLSFCLKSDGIGLTRFIDLAHDHDHDHDQELILSEVVDGFKVAPDAAAMVLDAIVGSGCDGTELSELGLFRRGWLVMLEGLVRVKAAVSVEVKEKAMEVAVEWRKRVSGCGSGEVEGERVLGFLLLVGAYGLVDRFGIDEVIDCFVVVARDRRAVDLCRRIVPASSVNDLIKKLIDKDMHVTAVNFSIGLQKTKEYPPVGLLEQRKLRSLDVIEDARKNVKDLHVFNDEINTLKSIIECIEENHLQSEYPKDSVVELVNRLENEVENSKQALVNDLCLRKQPTRAAVLKNQSQSRKQPARVAVSKNEVRLRQQPARAAAAFKNQQRLRKQPTRAAVLKSQKRLREQPARATALKNQPLSKSKKRELNKGQLTAESPAAAMPIQNGKCLQEFLSQKSDLSPDNVGECHNSPLGSGPTGSNAPYASPVVSQDGSTRAVNGTDPTGSNAPCASPVVSQDGSTRAVNGNDPTGSNAPCASPVVSHDGSTRAVIGNEPTCSNAPCASPVVIPDGSTRAVIDNEPTGSNAPYASPVASHDGSTRADIGCNFYDQQLLPPPESHSNGWISD